MNWMIDQAFDVDKATSLERKVNSVFIFMFEVYNALKTQPNDPSVQIT